MTSEEHILELLKQNQELLEKTYASAEKTRKYFLYSAIMTVLVFVVPLIFLAYYLPSFIDSYMNSLGSNIIF